MQIEKTFIDIFAGCGGMSKGFEQAGFTCLGFVEFWQPAIDTHLKNCEGELIGKDILKVENLEIERFKGKVQVLIGGPPCQGFSMAGKRDPNDTRNRLFLEFVRFLKIISPEYFVMENVQGIGSMMNPDAKSVLEEIFGYFKRAGYRVDVKVLDSSNYCVPEKRKRAIFIGNRIGKDNVFPGFKGKIFLKEVLTLPYEENKDMQHIYEQKEKKENYKFSHVKEGQNYGVFRSNFVKFKMDGFARTITKSGRYIHPVYNRIMSVREVARIQSFPDEFVFAGSINQMYQQIGNAVPVKMAEAIAQEIKGCLNG